MMSDPNHMRAFQVTTIGQDPILQVIDVPPLMPDTLQVQVKFCGLNFADTLMIKGTYQDTPEPPFTPGLELAGTITKVGRDVSSFTVGQNVAIYSGQGGLAEYGVFAAERCVLVPQGLSLEHAAGFQIAYGTSHLALTHKAHLKQNETLLVLGAAGGVGLTAVEVGHVLGARVIAVARGVEKCAIAKAAGADVVINSEHEDIRQTVLDLGGADVVYDPVGGSHFTDAFRACKPEARILIIGFASGDIPTIKPNHAMVKNISLHGLNWGAYLEFNPRALTESLKELMKWYEKGVLKPHVSHVLPFEQALEGLDLLRHRKSSGKVIIRVAD